MRELEFGSERGARERATCKYAGSCGGRGKLRGASCGERAAGSELRDCRDGAREGGGAGGRGVRVGYRSSGDGTSTLLNSAGAALYGTDDIFEASYRSSAGTTSQSDSPLTKISRSTYSALSNKLAQGQPSQYWVQRFIDRVTITLYTTPSASQAGDRIQFYYMSRIEDAGSYTNAADVPYFYIPCMCAGLAYYLSLKYSPERTQNLKLLYEDELLRAEAADGSSNSTYITPKSYYPSI